MLFKKHKKLHAVWSLPRMPHWFYLVKILKKDSVIQARAQISAEKHVTPGSN